MRENLRVTYICSIVDGTEKDNRTAAGDSAAGKDAGEACTARGGENDAAQAQAPEAQAEGAAGRAGEGCAHLPTAPFQALGIDISHNNAGPILWDSLRVMVDRSGRTVRNIEQARKVYPVKFVFIKATEGVSMRDPHFKANWTEAGKRDIQRGAYHFFRSSRDGAIQARHFIETVGPLRHADLPPVLDIETIHRGCTNKLLNERALQWLKEVGNHYGRKPIVYTSDSFARDILSDEIKKNYPIWIAHYDTPLPYFMGWTYWQFTDRAWVYGMPEPVDMSIRK